MLRIRRTVSSSPSVTDSSRTESVPKLWHSSVLPGSTTKQNKNHTNAKLMCIMKCMYVGYVCMYICMCVYTHTGCPPPPQKKKKKKNATVDQQLSLFTLFHHIFLIIITPRSSNLVENFLFYEYISYGLSLLGFAINLS